MATLLAVIGLRAGSVDGPRLTWNGFMLDLFDWYAMGSFSGAGCPYGLVVLIQVSLACCAVQHGLSSLQHAAM